MRTLLFANNRLGGYVAQYLAQRTELIGVVVHPPERRKAFDRFASLDVPMATWPHLPATEGDGPDCVLSVLFGYRLGPDILSTARWRAINLHPALLPHNRGAAPNVWPLVDGSPAGTTLHVMEASIDTGPVLCQQEVPVEPDDTAATLYYKLEAASLAMFCARWPSIEATLPVEQPPGGSSHRLRDLEQLDLSDDDLRVVDKLRARQFPPHGAEFERGGRRYRVSLEIRPVN